MENMVDKNRTLSFGLSPCPNDTFIFYGLLHHRVPLPCRLEPYMADVEELNKRVLARSIDVSKVSYHVLGHVSDDYVLLRSGSAMGRGCGPLLLAKTPLPRDLGKCRIAVPGEYTTATLLLRLFAPGAEDLVPMNFAHIIRAIVKGEVDAGIIIHETRFTYHTHGLISIQDLGAWWEKKTGLPIPLGGVIAKRSLGSNILQAIDSALKMSVKSALEDPEVGSGFVREHAQEMSREVIRQHIGLYVNQHTLDIGDEGMKAVEYLLDSGHREGIFPHGSTYVQGHGRIGIR